MLYIYMCVCVCVSLKSQSQIIGRDIFNPGRKGGGGGGGGAYGSYEVEFSMFLCSP